MSSPFDVDHIAVLNSDERARWIENDPEGFNNWCKRMVKVETDSFFHGKKTPRHRFSPDPTQP